MTMKQTCLCDLCNVKEQLCSRDTGLPTGWKEARLQEGMRGVTIHVCVNCLERTGLTKAYNEAMGRCHAM